MQTVKTHVIRHRTRRLINVNIVSIHQLVSILDTCAVKWTSSNFRRRTVRSEGVQILRVNTVQLLTLRRCVGYLHSADIIAGFCLALSMRVKISAVDILKYFLFSLSLSLSLSLRKRNLTFLANRLPRKQFRANLYDMSGTIFKAKSAKCK